MPLISFLEPQIFSSFNSIKSTRHDYYFKIAWGGKDDDNLRVFLLTSQIVIPMFMFILVLILSIAIWKIKYLTLSLCIFINNQDYVWRKFDVLFRLNCDSKRYYANFKKLLTSFFHFECFLKPSISYKIKCPPIPYLGACGLVH